MAKRTRSTRGVHAAAGEIQRDAASLSLKGLKTYRVALDRIHPVVRIAHGHVGRLNISSRFILDHELVAITKGQAVLEMDGLSVTLRRGGVALIRPFVVHRFVSTEDNGHVGIHFDLAADVPVIRDSPRDYPPYRVDLTRGHAFPTVVHLGAAHRLLGQIDSVVKAFESEDEFAGPEASSALLSVLLWLIRHESTAALPKSGHMVRMRRAAAYVEEHLDAPLSPGELATHIGLSESHFRRVFREWAGQSLMQYVTERRVARARQLLAGSDRTVQAIGRLVGYEDPFHFSRVFRRVDGLSPTEFRRIARAGESTA